MYPAVPAPACEGVHGVDLTLLLDTSTQVTTAGFAESIEFLHLLTDTLPINGAQVRVSLGTYDSEVVSIGSFSGESTVVSARIAAMESNYVEDDNGYAGERPEEKISGDGEERFFRWNGR